MLSISITSRIVYRNQYLLLSEKNLRIEKAAIFGERLSFGKIWYGEATIKDKGVATMADETNQEVLNPLTDLMKKKYGITKQGKLTFTEKDNLYTKLRKTATYIYRNGEWDRDQITKAIESYTQLQKESERGAKANVQVHEMTYDPDGEEFAENHGGKSVPRGYDSYGYTLTYQDGAMLVDEPRNILIDPKNKSWAIQGAGRFFIGQSSRQSWLCGNESHSLGYGKLFADIMKDWQASPESKGIPRKQMVDHLSEMFCNTKTISNGSSKWMQLRLSQIDKELEAIPISDWKKYTTVKPGYEDSKPDDQSLIVNEDAPENIKKASKKFLFLDLSAIQLRQNTSRMNRFLDNYLQKTYDIVLMQSYERDVNQLSHAKAFQTKKNINKATQQIMDQSVLNYHFKKLELDNSVDLNLFKRFERESHNLMKAMSKIEGAEKPALRLRKIKNHHATGLYYMNPLINTIVVDFRDGATSSFSHEYGHYLDYHLIKNDEKKLIPPTYSLSDEFEPILKQYRQNFSKLAAGTPLEKKADYYGTPTEVFARGYELWMKEHLHVRSNELGSSQEYDAEKGDLEYQAFDKDLRKELFKQLDSIPELATAKEKLKDHDFSKVEEKQLLEPTKADDPELLKNAKKLAAFSKKVLDKWLDSPERFAALISGTGYQLDQPNPNRVLAYDKLQTKALPQLVTAKQVKEAGVKPGQFKELAMPVFEQEKAPAGQKDKWVATPGFSLTELKEKAKGDDKARLEMLTLKPTKLRESLQLKPYFEGLEKEATKNLPEGAPVKVAVAIEKRMLDDALVQRTPEEQTQVEPFHFTPEEQKTVDIKRNPNVTKDTLREVFRYACNDAKRVYHEIQNDLILGQLKQFHYDRNDEQAKQQSQPVAANRAPRKKGLSR